MYIRDVTIRHAGANCVIGALVAALALQTATLLDSAAVQRRLAKVTVPPLEARFAAVVPAELAGFAGLIVLGGSSTRLREAGELGRKHKGLIVVVSGAGSAAEVMTALGGGIERERILIDEDASTTHENALLSARLIRRSARTAADARWLLVTSTWHMPRSIGVFRKVGLDVAAWPVREPAWVNGLGAARHEWLGLMWYRALGRTADLFPAPAARRRTEPGADA